MTTNELLWTVTEERRRQAAEAAREQLARGARRVRTSVIGGLVGWLRDRIRVRREPAVGPLTGASLR